MKLLDLCSVEDLLINKGTIPDVIRPVCLPQPGQVKMEDLIPSNSQWPEVLTSRFLKTKVTSVFTHSDCLQHNNNALVNQYGRTVYGYSINYLKSTPISLDIFIIIYYFRDQICTMHNPISGDPNSGIIKCEDKDKGAPLIKKVDDK